MTMLTQHTRSFRTAAWLGWQIDANWTDPFLFAIYSIVKPVAGVLILVVMYSVVTGGRTQSPIFPYIYIGNAFYIYVGAVMTGVSWAVIEDREHYRMLKYVYVAPVTIAYYLMGRGAARFVTGTVSVLITLAFGLLFLRLPIDWALVDWPLLLAAWALGIGALLMMGLVLAGVTLNTANHVYFVGEAVAAALYLFSGAIFPLDVLPAVLRPIGFALPLTYWLELIRRALLGPNADAFPTLAGFSNGQLFLILGGMTLFFGALSIVVFRYCDHRARERGLIDQTSNY